MPTGDPPNCNCKCNSQFYPIVNDQILFSNLDLMNLTVQINNILFKYNKYKDELSKEELITAERILSIVDIINQIKKGP